ncbi:MAG: ribosome small subunit-dependent GTPase A [Eubacteriaceae bacterium]|jgi:ribosome biogenesis GTPase|nr:ribosome small subunit-dependent GTPase A [Eubacteriaceae bacterium]
MGEGESNIETGTIVKGVGGFYTIRTDSGKVCTIRARGRFRISGVTPLVGDRVRFRLESGMMTEVLPRLSCLARPSVANATLGLIVASLKSPDASYPLLDKMLIQNGASGLKSAICFNKADLADKGQIAEVKDIYKGAGADLVFASVAYGEGLDEIERLLKGNTTIFSGVSGAGKSTIISKFCLDREIASQEISRKLRRGKNTTRHAEIYVTGRGDYIVDTPGFSLLDLSLPADAVWKHYPEFYDYSDCRYRNCMHLSEPGCSVKAAVASGQINPIRFYSYQHITRGLKGASGS